MSLSIYNITIDSATLRITNMTYWEKGYDYFEITGDISKKWYPVGNQAYETTTNLTGLNPGQTYNIYVWGFYSGGQEYFGNTSFTTDVSIPSVPSAPLIDTSYGNNSDGRFEGGFILKWGASSGATKYKVKVRRGYDSNIQEFSFGNTTSGMVYGLQYGVTYYFSVCAGNNYGYSAYSSENFGTTAPQTPTISLGTTTSNSITINTGSMSGNYDKIRIYRQDSGTYLECDANNSVIFTGLTTGQSYSFYAKSRFTINNTTIWSANQSDTITAKPSSPRPSNFYWDTSKVTGQQFNVTASEWNRLIQNVKDVHIYKLGGYNSSSYPMSNVSSGQQFYAQRFNEVRFAIGSLNSTGISTKYKGDTIYASELNILKDKLNAIT